MDPFLESIKNSLIDVALKGSPLGWAYLGADLASGGRLPAGFQTEDEKRKIGTPRVQTGGDLKYWAGPDWGYQSGEAFKQARGSYPAGFKPTPAAPAPAAGPDSTGSTIPPWTPPPSNIPAPPQLPAPSQKASIPQTEDKMPRDILEILKEQLTPERIAEIEGIRTGEALKRGLVTSLLAQRQSKEKTRREIELENIKSWQAIQTAKINANATQAAALASAIWSASQFQGGNPVLGAYEKTASALGGLKLK